MKDKWKVSVLTPVHNTPIEQLIRAYRSLLDQSFGFSGIQWVVVLHNCERDYITRVRELLGGQVNICLSEVSQEGTGVSFARNATLERAEGTYLFFLDSDDEMLPDCIGTVVDEMETAGADTAIFVAKVEGGNGMAVYYTDADPKLGTQVFDRGDPRISKSMCIGGMPLWCRCYRRDLVSASGILFDEDLDFGEDFIFNVRMTGRAGRVCVMPQLTGYRYYAYIGMTGSILESAAEKCVNGENGIVSLWQNEHTGLFLRSVYRCGRREGLDLNNTMWLLLTQFSHLFLFSDMPQLHKNNYLETARPLIENLKPPVMEWKEKQAELNSCRDFVRAAAKVHSPDPDFSSDNRQVIFVFVNPAWGHVTPLLGVIRALRDRGFHVRAYSGEGHAARLRKAGAVYVCTDDIYEGIDLSDREALGLFRWMEYARRLDPFIDREIKRWSPVLAIVDASTIWGRLIAEKHGLPMVYSSATMIMNYRTYTYWKPLIEKLGPHMEEINQRLLELSREGFPAKEMVGLYQIRENEPCIVYTSRMIQPKSDLYTDKNTCFAGYSRFLPPVQRAAAPDRKRPFVYVTLGTVASINVFFFRSCMSAFREMDVDVLMVIWENVSIAQLGEIPSNVKVAVRVNQDEVLRQADVALFHAGMNTMSDCLLLGVPMVAFPSFGEQYGNARRIQELNVGIVIDNYRPDTIRQAVQNVLSDEQYRKNARAVGEDMRRYKGGEGAADWICDRFALRPERTAGPR